MLSSRFSSVPLSNSERRKKEKVVELLEVDSRTPLAPSCLKTLHSSVQLQHTPAIGCLTRGPCSSTCCWALRTTEEDSETGPEGARELVPPRLATADIQLRGCDYYHTCYCLSGLSVSQNNCPGEPPTVVGSKENLLVGPFVVAFFFFFTFHGS